MAILQIENLPDELYERLQSLAADRRLTVNEAVIDLLQQATQPNPPQTLQANQLSAMSDILNRMRSRSRVDPTHFGLPNSTTLIREDRNR